MADMNAVAVPGISPGPSLLEQKLKKSSPGRLGMLIFGLVLAGGIVFIGIRIMADLSTVHVTSAWPYELLGLALLIALGFEFVNGFHDTANAVATVIYTHSLEPHVAVVWSGIWNLIGVLLSSGAVAFAVVSLLPVELILQVGRGAGFAMVFALLVSAILWNLGTWWFGLPASSSHTLIGSIIGVGLANQLMAVKTGTSGVDWGQAGNVFRSLLISPLVGFACAAVLLLLAKKLIRDPQLYRAPEGTEPPPFWIRALLVLTCTGVSFAHGSNDGQKGMGLIMLILIGTVPTAYALNHAVGINQVQDFAAVSEQAIQAVNHYIDPNAVVGDTRDEVTDLHPHARIQAQHHAGHAAADRRHRARSGALQGAREGARRSTSQRAQRHVRDQRSAALDAEVRQAGSRRKRYRRARELQKTPRSRDEIHSHAG